MARHISRLAFVLLSLYLFIQNGSAVFQWLPSSPADGASVPVCEGEEAILDWIYTLGPQEQLEDIRWYTSADHSSQMIAVFTDGNFVAMPTFSGRVRHLGSARLALENVTLLDKGNYSVDVSVHHDAGTYTKAERSVYLQVTGCGTELTGSEVNRLVEQVASLQSQMDDLREQCTNQINHLSQVVHSLQADLHQGQGSGSVRVSFHAHLDISQQVIAPNPVILSRVANNEGGGYSPNTGAFTAPVNGTYVFLASVGVTGPSNSNKAALSLMAGDREYCLTYSRYSDDVQGSTCHAVLHLGQGDRVWLKAVGTSEYWMDSTVFSGFLLNAD